MNPTEEREGDDPFSSSITELERNQLVNEPCKSMRRVNSDRLFYVDVRIEY